MEQSENPARLIWNTIRAETGRNKSRNVKYSPEITANDFNNFFIDNVQSLVARIPRSGIQPEQLFKALPRIELCMFFMPVIADDIRIIIHQLKNKKTQDIDDLNSYLIKNCAEYIVEPLVDVINACLCKGVFPDPLKIGRVVPLFKKGETTELKNYRPISILPVFSKIFEYVIYKQTIGFLNKYKILTSNQFGFREHMSTVDAINGFVQFVYNSFENKQFCRGVFTDLSSAFDCVDHGILLKKMEHYGFRGSALNLFKSYLSERSQKVEYRGLSKGGKIIRGVPQGSILGPLLFLLYVNDLPANVDIPGVMTIAYADDTSIVIQSSSMRELDDTFGGVMDRAKDWFDCNELALNVEKTVTIDLRTQVRNNEDIKSIKFLGVTIDQSLTWRDHIGGVCEKLARGVYAVRKIKQIVGGHAAKLTYYASFHSHMSYGLRIWGNAAHTNLQKIFLLQKAAVRAIVNADRDVSCKHYFLELKIMTLFSLIVLVNLCDTRRDIESFNKQHDNHNYNTRNKSNVSIPRQRLKKTNNLGIALYNALPSVVRELPIKIFKRKLKLFLTNNCLYSVHEYFNRVKQINVP